MSSYNLSIKSIIYGCKRPIVQSTLAQALLVAIEYTPQQARLFYTIKEVEIVRGLIKLMDLDPIEPGRHKQDIILYLLQYKIFHFASYSYIDDKDLSSSHLLLEDRNSDPLTVAILLEINLYKHSPFLAYLSACRTG